MLLLGFGCVSNPSSDLPPGAASPGASAPAPSGSDGIGANNSSAPSLDPLEVNVTQQNPLHDGLTPSPSAPSNIQSVPLRTQGYATPDPTRGATRSSICAISVDPQVVLPGKEGFVRIYANSRVEDVSFLCGDEERQQGHGGVFQDSILCRFDQSGIYPVWIALDGRKCATFPVLVQSSFAQQNPSCLLLNSGRGRTAQGSYSLWGSFYISNYPPNSSLGWSCADTAFSTPLSNATQNGSTSFVNVSCVFDVDPSSVARMPVAIDAHECASVGA